MKLDNYYCFEYSDNSSYLYGWGIWLEGVSEWNHLEAAGSIPTTGKNNEEYFIIT